MNDALTNFAAAARGLPVSHVWRGYGSAMFLEFGKLTPRTRRDGSPGIPRGEMSVMLEATWRIEDERSILCGSWSDEELWEPTFAKLLGRNVENITTFARLPEVAISLAGDMHVCSFSINEGDPHWALFDRRGPELITLHSRAGQIVNE